MNNNHTIYDIDYMEPLPINIKWKNYHFSSYDINEPKFTSDINYLHGKKGSGINYCSDVYKTKIKLILKHKL